MITLYEDNAGGLWLRGESVDGERIHYGDLAASRVVLQEIVMAYQDGVSRWAHDWQHGGYACPQQDEGCQQCQDPEASYDGLSPVATYDGTEIILYPAKMGRAAQQALGL